MDKWGPQLDLARRIGLEPILTEFLIVSQSGNTEGRRQNAENIYWRNLNVFAYSSTTKSRSNKRSLPFDSACLKGAEIPFHGILIVVGSDTGDDEVVWAEF